MHFSYLLLALIAIPTWARATPDFHLEKLEEGEPRLEGAQCEFSAAKRPILKSDWISKVWIKIDGKLQMLESTRTKTEMNNDADSKSWRESFQGQGINLTLVLKKTGTGEDTASNRGHILIKRNAHEKRFAVEGGCGA